MPFTSAKRKKNGFVGAEPNARRCIHCNEPIDKDSESRISINRRNGFGLVGLAHRDCHEKEGWK